ncbi:MAG TPA: PLP-dependent aminotransferase family protein [Woeseiaceae bacterium]|nr:PLP-dependent aminotransferase family protein [Woeseiaceae bacterium]
MYLELDGQGPRYAQLIRSLKGAILEARLAAGARLPATRALADELGVSRNTVMIAYEQLVAEGFAVSQVGAGTFVTSCARRTTVDFRPSGRTIAAQSRFAARARENWQTNVTRRHIGLRYNLSYGIPLTDSRLAAAWRQAVSRAVVNNSFDYTGARGQRSLREAICDYLALRRGISTRSDNVLVVSGAQQAFDLTARVLLNEDDSVVLEDPGYFGSRQVMQAHGAAIQFVSVDNEGLRCEDLPTDGTKLVCVTPSHQFPSGAVLSLERRLELLQYATKHDAWIVEDDYDGEFRYDSKPLAALRSLDDNDRVIYVGSFSKILFPALRLGYIVVPEALKFDFKAAKWNADLGSPAVEQIALANLMQSPSFDKRLRSAKRTLKARRNALIRGLRRYAGDHVDIVDTPAGMHTVVWLRNCRESDCDNLIALASQRSLGLYAIKPHYAGRPPRPGLLLGYAGLSPADIDDAMRILGECLDAVLPSTN